MIDHINIAQSSDNSIHIENGEQCNVNSVICITVPSKEPSSIKMGNTYIFNVEEDGKIVFNTAASENTNKPASEGILDMFEKIPEDLSDYEVNKIVDFLNVKLLTETKNSRIYPYSVKLTDNGDIKVTFVIYNRDSITLGLPKLPVKLTDAHKNVVFAELVDLNAVVNCGKIGIVQTLITRENLKEKNPDLDQWDITFGV